MKERARSAFEGRQAAMSESSRRAIFALAMNETGGTAFAVLCVSLPAFSGISSIALPTEPEACRSGVKRCAPD